MKKGIIRKVILLTIALGAAMLYFVCAAFENMGDYPHKIWLHRCNSIEKLEEMRDMYPNVEVDVVFRSAGRTMDVTHDLDKTFNLDLEEYFRYYAHNDGKMWLDVKNMDADNRDSILAELTHLSFEYGVDKGRLIVESSQWELLDAFTREGFYTSYYVPYDKPGNLDRLQVDDCIEAIEQVAASGCVKAVSFPYWWYSHIRKGVDGNVDLLTWKHRSSQFLFLLSGEGKRMLEDARLKVVLVKDKGNFHR